MEQIMPLMKEYLSQGKPVTFAPRGISMKPMLRPGTDKVVLERPKGSLTKYDIPLYKRDDGSYVLHRVIKVGDTYTCIGDNQFEKEYGIRYDQIIAVVTGFYRDEKFYSTKNIGYILYSRLWHYSRFARYLCLRALRGIRRKLR